VDVCSNEDGAARGVSWPGLDDAVELPCNRFGVGHRNTAAARCSNDTAIHHLKTVFPQVS